MKTTNNTISTESFKKLLAAVLDDSHGVSQDAYNIFCDVAKNNVEFSEALNNISEHIMFSKGRVFLPEDWSETE